MLASAAQPLQTDDAWWHLALGRAYASQGPWLAADPLLHTATGPPAPAAWLADLGLYALGALAGFPALRVGHALAVAAILALAWSLLRRASGSASAASLLACAFVALSAYRLFQLRPELVTVLATLALYRLVLEGAVAPSWSRVGLACALLGVWANAHSGFLLGPVLLACAVGGLGAAAALAAPGARRSDDVARLRRLSTALVLGLAATLVNPSGVAHHLAWFRAGAQTPELALVVDEWTRFDPFRAPVANLPPSPLAWGLAWAILALGVPLALRAALRWRRGGARDPGDDPVLVALALAALAAVLLAVRFLWLGIFPLLLLARSGAAAFRVRRPRRALAAAAVVGAALSLVAAFVRLGDWPMISGMLPASTAGWAQPYPPVKYQAQAVWLLADAGLDGKLMNEYVQGGFLGYWLAPELRAFVNGSLNLPKQALAAQVALVERRGLGRVGFLELLDLHRVDLFLGVGLPQAPRPNRPRIYSSGHLEGAPGWIPVFRDPQSAAYLRGNERNRPNLARIAEHYAREGVPFDPLRGFDPAAAIRENPAWAVAHGVIPVAFASIEAEARGSDPARKRDALDRLASLYVALGLYEDAIELDRRLLRSNPGAIAPARRLVWSLLRLGRRAEASEAAQALAQAPKDGISAAIAAAARQAAASGDDGPPAALLAQLPVFTRAEASRVASGLLPAPARPWRRELR